MLDKHGETFLHRVFTQSEIEYSSPRKAIHQHLAGRWAAKEAILKAIGTGWARGIRWTDIEVVNLPGGAPEVRIHGAAIDVCQEKGIDKILVSISHVKTYATAYATALGPAS